MKEKFKYRSQYPNHTIFLALANHNDRHFLPRIFLYGAFLTSSFKQNEDTKRKKPQLQKGKEMLTNPQKIKIKKIMSCEM